MDIICQYIHDVVKRGCNDEVLIICDHKGDNKDIIERAKKEGYDISILDLNDIKPGTDSFVSISDDEFLKYKLLSADEFDNVDNGYFKKIYDAVHEKRYIKHDVK